MGKKISRGIDILFKVGHLSLLIHGYQTALIKLIEDWRLAIDKEKFVGVISTDTSKAFDYLLLSLMVKKLQAYNFSDK